MPKIVLDELDAVAHTYCRTVELSEDCYHITADPIELELVQVKHKVADKNATFWLSDVEILMNSVLDNAIKSVWRSCAKHTKIKIKILGINGFMLSSWTQ
jgi:hypothetical protein